MAIKANFNTTTGVLTATGGNQDDTITFSDPAGTILINGGAVSIDSIDGSQPTLANTKEIDVFGGNGDDMISLGNAVLPPAKLFGGNGNDTLIGGAGDDILDGGNGDDTVVGGKGTDTAFLGAGNDKFIWNPGDGNDKVDGGIGFDTLDFKGKTTGETFSIDANGSGATFNRVNGTIDLTSVERIQFEAQGQNANNITIHDLTGTSVKQVAIDLVPDDGHGQADTVNIFSTNGNPITVADNNGVVTVSGLASDVTISNFAADDQLFINGQPVTVANGQTVTVTAASSNNTRGTSTA